VVPFPKAKCEALKAAAGKELPEGAWVSSDDVVLAHVWKAMCEMRCRQLGLPLDSEEMTTCARACNIRKRTSPPLGAGYCANGVVQVFTSLSVRELLSSAPSAVAQHLRASLQANSPQHVAALVKWQDGHWRAGRRVTIAFDARALTFVVSSWVFDWEGIDFKATPVAFDHGALVPIVVVFTVRPAGDGLNVYSSGPRASLEQYSSILTASLNSA